MLTKWRNWRVSKNETKFHLKWLQTSFLRSKNNFYAFSRFFIDFFGKLTRKAVIKKREL